MTDIDPLWHSTADDTVIVHQHAAVGIMDKTSTVARWPAALVGISFVAGVGMLFFQGFQSLQGQANDNGAPTEEQAAATSTPVIVTITTSGFEPASITVLPGQEIQWTNNDTVPHILQSDTLRNESGTTLYTPVIFEGATQSFVVARRMNLGSYEYLSTTKDGFNGTIIVAATLPASSSSSLPIVTPPAAPPAPVVPLSDSPIFPGNLPVPPSLPQGQVNGDAGAVTVPGQDNLPHNPYTVDAMANQPFDNHGNPIDPSLHAGADLMPRPLSQPNSGPGVWLVCLGAIAALLFLTRKQFRAAFAQQ